MQHLKAHYRILSIEDMTTRVLQGTLNGRCLAISFDDGFVDNYTNAFPVLQRYNIPATFFVSTGFIDSSGDAQAEASFCLEQLGIEARASAMSWDHLKEMSEAGYTVGSHTVTHAKLAGLGDTELQEELVLSRRRIERTTGTACRYFAHPFGRAADLDRRSLDAIRGSGYEACFASVTGNRASIRLTGLGG